MPLTPATTDKFMKVGSPGTATTLSAPGYTDGVTTAINVVATTNWPTDTLCAFAMDSVTVTAGVATRTPGTYCEFVGIVTSGTTIGSIVRRYGTGQNYAAGSLTRVYIPVTGTRENDLIDGLNQDHNGKGNHKNLTDDNGLTWLGRSQAANAVNFLQVGNSATGVDPSLGATGTDSTVHMNLTTTGGGRIKQNGSSLLPIGMLIPFAGLTAPAGWLVCDGSAVSRTTYPDLFGAIAPSIGTFTITIAAPAVVTLAAHGFVTGDQVFLTTTGALPTGLTANTLYYVVKIDANTFNLSTSRANAYAGTKITTTGTQSGIQTLRACPHGLGDGSTTFNVPDTRGRVLAGTDSLGGTAASRLTLAQTQGVYGNIGAVGGEQGHQITIAELASHTHQVATALAANGTEIASASGSLVNGSATGLSNTGSDTAHNNVQPTLVVNHLIKT